MDKIVGDAEIGKRIKNFRLQAGLTQEKLAECLEITFQQVQKYERGATKVNLLKLQQIAYVLNVPVQAFFDTSVPTVDPHTDLERQLLQAFRKIKGAQIRTSVVNVVVGLSQRKQ